MYYFLDKNIASGRIILLSGCETTYPVSLVVFLVSKSNIGHYLYTDDIKATSTPQNGARNYVISGITTPFSFINIDPNDPSVKTSTQS